MKQSCRILIASLAGVVLSGCTTPTPRPDPRDAGLNDPMNYNPAAERRDVSGGGLMDDDRKEMKKDIDDVLNP